MKALFTSWMFWCGVTVGLALNISLYILAEIITAPIGGR